MRAVAQLRSNGLQPAEITERLRQQPATALQSPLESIVAPPAVHNDLVPAHDAIQAFLQRTEALDKLTDIDRRLERVEHTRSLVWVALGGVAVGALVVSVIVWLLSMLR